MNRKIFMERLEALLRDLPEDEREEALQYYRDYFDDAGSENEARVIDELGSPERVAQTIRSGMSEEDSEYTEHGYADARFRDHQDVSPRASGTGSRSGEASGKRACSGAKTSGTSARDGTGFWKILSIILLCILLIPVIIPAVCVALAIILAIAAGIIAIVVGAAAAGAALLITGVVLIGCGIWQLFVTPAAGLCLGGAGCLILAFGIVAALLITAAGIKLIPWLIRSIVKLISFPLRKAGVIS